MQDNRSIVIAEDDSDDRLLLETAFKETGLQLDVVFAHNGVDLLKILTDENNVYPRVILLDLNMPKKDGRESLKEIKQHPHLKKIPVVIFTTTKNESEIARCYELGANTYVVKPDSYSDLLKVVSRLKAYWFETASVALR
ncbi:MAG: response regulator [Cyclobacteriaceae bacterium]|nr:response regulator [Cyclobacteriaceae bacterium]